MKSVLLLIVAIVSVILIPNRASLAFDMPLPCAENSTDSENSCWGKNPVEEITNAIWNYSSRTFAQIDSLAIQGLDRVTQATPAEAPLTGQVAGAKVIETESNPLDLITKLDSTGQTLDQLQLSYQRATSDIGLIGLKWDSLEAGEATTSLDETIALLDSPKEIDWLTKSWGWPELSAISSKSLLAKGSLVTVRNIIATSGMQPEAYANLKSALKSLEAIEQLVGEGVDVAGKPTLFGRYNQAQGVAREWNNQLVELDKLLRDEDKLAESEMQLATQDVLKRVLALNQIPNADLILSDQFHNKILGLIGLVNANKDLMAQDQGLTLTTTWLEEGSTTVVFKTLVTNPSPVSRQGVAIRYYLPAEIKNDDLIVDHSPEVTINLDADRHQYYVAGDLTVAAGDTRTVTVSTNDIWRVSKDQVASIRQQAAQLVQALENTSHYAQGVTLKSDIEVALDKIDTTQGTARTPEQRIIAFREGSLQLAIASEKLIQLQQVGDSLLMRSWHSLMAQEGSSAKWLGVVAVGLVLLASAAWALLHEDGNVVSDGKSTRRRGRPSLGPRQFQPFSEAIASSDL